MRARLETVIVALGVVLAGAGSVALVSWAFLGAIAP
jgi:hypothetical protein